MYQHYLPKVLVEPTLFVDIDVRDSSEEADVIEIPEVDAIVDESSDVA